MRFVRQVRLRQPRVGTRKLHYLLQGQDDGGLKVGRDRLFQILAEHRLLVPPRRAYHKTTHSFHRFYRHSVGLRFVSCPAATKTPGTMPGSVALAPAPMQALLLIVKSTVRHGTNKAPITRPGIMASHAGGERHKRLDSRNEGRELKPG